jgi:DNA-binding transcriptional MerR regulator
MTGVAAASVKSPEAFRTISEVAEMLDIPQHVLRFWESRFAHIKPIKRAGGRRFYRPEDVDLLRGIRTLLYHEGYTIKGVQKILREKGVRYAAEVGRAEPQKNGPARKQKAAQTGEVENGSGDEAENGFDALATLARVHDAAAERIALDGERRARLESLLNELLALKQCLRTARAKVLV